MRPEIKTAIIFSGIIIIAIIAISSILLAFDLSLIVALHFHVIFVHKLLYIVEL